MRKLLIALGAAAVLGGCADAEKMERVPYIKDVIIPGGYQAVFARTKSTALGCWGSGGSFDLDGQLYPDLHYAELTQTNSLLGQQILVRFDETGSNTRLRIKMTSIGGKETLATMIEQWARGGKSCDPFSYR